MAKIELRNVSLTFRIRQHGRFGLKEFIIRRLRKDASNPLIEVDALKNASLKVDNGERVGVVGANGAGKSTLLRVISGVYPPTQGERVVEGRLDSLLDIGLGIEPHAKAWDNIAYRCYLHGDTPDEVRTKRERVVEFSELGKFLHMPIRFFSAGMYVRFAFSVATAIDPEILLLDEVFGAGDIGFRQKARRRMVELVDKAHILVFVSHDLGAIRQFCNRVIWLEKGRVREDGPAEIILEKYTAHAGARQASA
ncbi:sugar ABC transporter [Planctomycetaceae bacterium SCGC AG-212-D15]|nr:sugar ABC transporter [Planctomycetaceae bacterium SCGC AG-212-D15]